jgi:hypothetical protein
VAGGIKVGGGVEGGRDGGGVVGLGLERGGEVRGRVVAGGVVGSIKEELESDRNLLSLRGAVWGGVGVGEGEGSEEVMGTNG